MTSMEQAQLAENQQRLVAQSKMELAEISKKLLEKPVLSSSITTENLDQVVFRLYEALLSSDLPEPVPANLRAVYAHTIEAACGRIYFFEAPKPEGKDRGIDVRMKREAPHYPGTKMGRASDPDYDVKSYQRIAQDVRSVEFEGIIDSRKVLAVWHEELDNLVDLLYREPKVSDIELRKQAEKFITRVIPSAEEDGYVSVMPVLAELEGVIGVMPAIHYKWDLPHNYRRATNFTLSPALSAIQRLVEEPSLENAIDVYRWVLPYAENVSADSGIIKLLADPERQQRAAASFLSCYKDKIARSEYPQSETEADRDSREALQKHLSTDVMNLFDLGLLKDIDQGCSAGLFSNGLRRIAGMPEV